MNLVFTPTAWEQYIEWQQTDKSMVKQINKLIKDIERNGLLKGLGKPEPLKCRKMSSSFYIVQEPSAEGRKLSPSCFLPVSFYQSLRLRSRLLQNSEAGKTGIRYTNASGGRGFRKRR